jgi:hypothetical protein
MNRPFIKSLWFCLSVGMGLGLMLAPPLSAKEVFRAKLLTAGGPIQEKMVTIKITINEFTTPDDVRRLHSVLLERGSDEFMKAFRKSKKGSLNFIGARGLNVRINAVQVVPTDEGRKILIFTERQNWGGTERTAILRKHFFMALELNLNTEGIGTGRFYPGASIQLSNTGAIILESFLPPEQILGVRKVG